MLNYIFIFIFALLMVIKGSTMATEYASRLPKSYKLSKYTVGFLIIAVISILPETFIAINSAVESIPTFGLATLFGSNVADLTLVFALIVLLSRRNLKIESKILKNHKIYPLILLLPLILGLDGNYSRIEGLALILTGGTFYYLALKTSAEGDIRELPGSKLKNSLFLALSMLVLLIGAHYTVTSAVALAKYWKINPTVIGLLIVGLGTTIPEFFFSLKAAKKREDSMAIGDLLGTVLADATIVVGILAMIKPFEFPQTIMYVSGSFMVLAALLLFKLMRTGQHLTKREAFILLGFWIAFAVTEYLANNS